MNVIVTGGAGFIGSHLCERLIREKYNVFCVDNFITGSKNNVNHLVKDKKFTLIKHDIVESLPQNYNADLIFHLASPASPNHHSPLSYHALPEQTMFANTKGTWELLKVAYKRKARFLFASTSEVYGDPLVHPQPEEYRGNVSPVGPRSVYDEAKRFGETITAYFTRSKNVNARIARIFNTYGPRMVKNDMRMCINFIRQAISNKPITVFGDGTQTRSLCYISDVVEGLMRLMFYPNTTGEVVNIGSSEEHTVMEYAKLIKKLTNSKSEIVCVEKLPEDDPKKRRPDITKAKKLLGWKPEVSLEKGLLQMIERLK